MNGAGSPVVMVLTQHVRDLGLRPSRIHFSQLIDSAGVKRYIQIHYSNTRENYCFKQHFRLSKKLITPKPYIVKSKFLVYSVLEPAVGYLTTLHFTSQQRTHPTLV